MLWAEICQIRTEPTETIHYLVAQNHIASHGRIWKPREPAITKWASKSRYSHEKKSQEKCTKGDAPYNREKKWDSFRSISCEDSLVQKRQRWCMLFALKLKPREQNICLSISFFVELRFAMSGSEFGALTRFQGISHPHSTFFSHLNQPLQSEPKWRRHASPNRRDWLGPSAHRCCKWDSHVA